MEIKEVNEDDFKRVMAIRKDVYGGFDYLPDHYMSLIKTPGCKGYAIIFKGEFIAFSLVLCIDDGKTIVTRASRVSKEWEGKGVFKKLDQYIEDKYRKEDGVVFKALSFSNDNTKMLKQIEEGNVKLISKKTMHMYRSTAEDIRKVIADRDKTASYSVLQLGIKEIENIFSSRSLCEELFPDDRIIVNWVLYRLIKTNIPLIASENCFASNLQSSDRKPLLSFGRTINCSSFLYYQLDIYGEVSDVIIDHVSNHLKKVVGKANGEVIIFLYLYGASHCSISDNAFAYFGFEKCYTKPMYMQCAEGKIK